MPNKKISELPNGSALTGGESLEAVQAGINVKITSQDVADLATGSVTLDLVTTSTSGGTITLNLNTQIQRMFVGSASFGTAKAIALSNDSVALVLNLVVTLTNVAAVITFPSTFTMQSDDGRWNDGAHTFTPLLTGKYEFSATWDDTDWNLKVAGPYS